MRIFRINNYTAFTGIRQDRNTVEQLKHDNPYDLNLPNQRRISKAIEDLGNVSGEDNINFLLDVSDNLRYGTNIDIGKKPYNDWKAKLNAAAKKSFDLSDKSVQEKLAQKLTQAFSSPKNLTKEEKEILANSELLLSKINPEELKNVKNSNTANIKRNLSYFVVSSEVPIAQKLYILKKLNYLMSDDYVINPQLKDKKTQVLAEILNDITVNTPESKIPNIKAVNQRQFGICAAISICRKALAYEDKQNYVDMVLTELDNSDYMQVYDRANLGKHQKVPVPKAKIDYDYALSKGYRIVDASAMNWMNAADTVGAFNDVIGAYSAFDKDNFGTFSDTHIHKDIDAEKEKYQDYYRSCMKSKEAVVSCKRKIEKQKYYTSIKSSQEAKNISEIHQDTALIHSILNELSPSLTNDEIRHIGSDLLSLSVDNSDKQKRLDGLRLKYSFINNETDESKSQKVASYLSIVLPSGSDKELIEEKSKDIVDLITEIHAINRGHSMSQAQRYSDNISLFQAAAAYRTMYLFALDIPNYLTDLMKKLNVPDNESLLIENLQTLSRNIRSGKINPELKEKLFERFGNEVVEKAQGNDGSAHQDEVLAEVMDDYVNTVNLMRTTFMDDLYHALLLGDRKQVLSTQIASIRNEIEVTKDKSVIESVADEFGLKPNRNILLNTFDKYLDILDDENCTEEQYLEILNKSGHKSHLLDLKDSFDNTFELLFREPNPSYIAGFNLINGAPQNADIEVTQQLYKALATSFNNMSLLIKTLQDTLQISSEDGTLLNTADPKYVVLKKLENMGEIPTEKELTSLRNKFDKFYESCEDVEGLRVKFKDLPKEITTFTPMEKEALAKYRQNINSWYATSTRRLNDIYTFMKEPLEELNREIGVQKGEYWTKENESGLMDNQALKIFEHMTDRPYYEERNIRAGLNKIKNAPYSGTSMTSVRDDEPAMHAQYVVDVKPTVLASEDTRKIHDIIFHDNSWGASEHENIWTDSQGLLRTDYSAEYGGQLGYITNDQYQNGKIDDNLIDKRGEYKPQRIPSRRYNKLVNDGNEQYSFPLIRSLILQGVSPQAMSTVKTIKQTLLLPSYEYIDELTEYASNMTRDELKSTIKKIETAGDASRKLYPLLLKRIEGDNTFDKGIDSEEKYYKLASNDKLRLIAEKVAIIKSYDDIPDINTYNIEVKSQKDLDKLHVKLQAEARKNFDYIMAKNPEILRYGVESSREDIYRELKNFVQENNLKLSYKTMTKIVNSMKKIKGNEYNGSINQGIDLVQTKFEKSLKIKTNVSDDKIKALSNKIRPLIEKNLTITEKDVKTGFNSYRNQQIAQWIDREFAPKTDKEFAQILNSLRNMTQKEYIQKYDSKITDTDLGIKSISGYDIVKMIRNGNETIKNAFINTVFSESYYKDIDESKTRAYYDLKKLSRNLSGGTYVGGKRSFDDLYSDFYYNFRELTVKKEFNKHKDEAFRKYGAFPAYPQVEISTPEDIENSLNTFNEKLNNYMDYIYAYKKQQVSLEIVADMRNYANSKLPKTGDITPGQYKKITLDIQRLMSLNLNDETIQGARAGAMRLLASGTRDVEQFREYIDSVYNTFKLYEKTADGKTMKEAQQIALASIDEYKKTYVIAMFEPKYQRKALELLNKWISAKSKAVWVKDHFNSTLTDESSDMSKNIADNYSQNVENADEIFNQFRDLFYKHRLLETPDRYMKEYLMLCTKDAKHPDTKYTDGSEVSKNALNALKNAYKTNLKSLLYKADMMELQSTLMDCARKGNLNAVRDAFKNSTLELTNGTVVSMDSEEGLNIIVAPMLNEESLDTAALFLNQLGLSENVARMISDKQSFDVAYKNFNRIQTILKSADSQAKFVKSEFKQLENFDNNPDYEKIILDYKNKVLEKCKKTKYRAAGNIFEVAIDDALNDIKKFPDQSKTIILGSCIDQAISGLRQIVSLDIDDLNTSLLILQRRYDLLNKLLLPDNSPVANDVEEYILQLQELLLYEASVQKNFPNIGITSA